MKHLKMLGLAAIAALGLMSFAGAGTASATTLFTDSAKTIHYFSSTTIHEVLKTGTSVTLKDTSNNTIATCTASTTHSETTVTSTTWITIRINTHTWEGCSQTTDNVNLGSLEIMWTSGTSGEVRGKGSNLTLNIFGVSCTYGTGEGTTLGTFTGGSAPELSINAALAKSAGGFLCPSTALFQATYIIQSPHALFVGA